GVVTAEERSKLPLQRRRKPQLPEALAQLAVIDLQFCFDAVHAPSNYLKLNSFQYRAKWPQCGVASGEWRLLEQGECGLPADVAGLGQQGIRRLLLQIPYGLPGQIGSILSALQAVGTIVRFDDAGEFTAACLTGCGGRLQCLVRVDLIAGFLGFRSVFIGLASLQGHVAAGRRTAEAVATRLRRGDGLVIPALLGRLGCRAGGRPVTDRTADGVHGLTSALCT